MTCKSGARRQQPAHASILSTRGSRNRGSGLSVSHPNLVVRMACQPPLRARPLPAHIQLGASAEVAPKCALSDRPRRGDPVKKIKRARPAMPSSTVFTASVTHPSALQNFVRTRHAEGPRPRRVEALLEPRQVTRGTIPAQGSSSRRVPDRRPRFHGGRAFREDDGRSRARFSRSA